MPKSDNYAYLCNGEGCSKQCAKTMSPEEWAKYQCHHTFDEKFAKTKVRRDRKFKFDGKNYREVAK